MKGASLFLTLGIVVCLVTLVASASPRRINAGTLSDIPVKGKNFHYSYTEGNSDLPYQKQKYNDKDDSKEESEDPTYFPAYLKLLFQTKSSLQSGLNRLEDGKDVLDKLKKQISLLYDISVQVETSYETMASFLGCGIYEESVPTRLFRSAGMTIVYYQNKCYVLSDNSGSLSLTSQTTYDKARQICLKHGGDLAQPSLLQGSDFGIVVANIFKTTHPAYPAYWMYGSNGASPGPIISGGGFTIPDTFFRYKGVANFPYTSMSAIPANSGLVLAGPLSAITNNWYIDVQLTNTMLPYICEFRSVFNPSAIGKLKLLKSAQSNGDLEMNLKNKIETNIDIGFGETLKNAEKITISPLIKNVGNADHFQNFSFNDNQFEQVDVVKKLDYAENIANSEVYSSTRDTLENTEKIENIPHISGNADNANSIQIIKQVEDFQKSEDIAPANAEIIAQTEIYGISETLQNAEKIENNLPMTDTVYNVINLEKNYLSNNNQDNVNSNQKFEQMEEAQKPVNIVTPENAANIDNADAFNPTTLIKQLEKISELIKTDKLKLDEFKQHENTLATEITEILPIADENISVKTYFTDLNAETLEPIENEKPNAEVQNNSFSLDNVVGTADAPMEREDLKPKFTAATSFETDKEIANTNIYKEKDDLEPRQFDENKRKLLLEDILAKLELLEQLE